MPYAIAFLAGAAVMALELLATRWLAPAFGATLSTWSWVIAVTLGAGSLGAWLSGSARGRVAPLLFASGLYIALEAILAPGFVRTLLAWPIDLGTAVATLGLLALPVALLSMVVPALLSARSAKRPGPLLAASALGAMVGTLLTGLYSVPGAGLQATAIFLALLLGVAAAVAGRFGKWRTLGVLFLAHIALVSNIDTIGVSRFGNVERESLAGRVALSHRGAVWTLRVDGLIQGTAGEASRDGAGLVLRGQHLGLLPYLRPGARTALLVGLGTGMLGTTLARHEVRCETLEVDAVLADVVRRYLRFDGSVHIGDGRALWRRLKGPYDLIVLDAFQAEALPPHLLTVEALRELRGLLAANGVLAVHLIGEPEHRVTAAVARTLSEAFPQRLAVRSGGEGGLQDLVLLGSDALLRVPPDPALLAAGWDGSGLFVPPLEGALLTDDHNPLEVWNEPLARALRARSR